ncbi:DUF4389 domain-containing protein [Chloroflexota bacterium]
MDYPGGLEEESVPVRLTITYPERLSRWRLFFKWLFFIPLYVLAVFYSIAYLVVTFISFFAILITGRLPRNLFNFMVGYGRFVYRIMAYFPYLLVDKWWPAGIDHPLQYEVAYPDKLSRGILLLKVVSYFAVAMLANLFSSGLALLAIPMWFAILFTGRYPKNIYTGALKIYQRFVEVTA